MSAAISVYSQLGQDDSTAGALTSPKRFATHASSKLLNGSDMRLPKVETPVSVTQHSRRKRRKKNVGILKFLGIVLYGVADFVLNGVAGLVLIIFDSIKK